MSTNVPGKHVHGEAFLLMTYGCQCGHREVIWNSRDGVTPFCLGCPCCGQLSLQHVEWNRDTYAPNHQLHPGQRFWRDGTPDEAEAIVRRWIESAKERYPVSPEQAEELIRSSREGGADGGFQKGWPTIDQFPRAAAAPPAPAPLAENVIQFPGVPVVEFSIDIIRLADGIYSGTFTHIRPAIIENGNSTAQNIRLMADMMESAAASLRGAAGGMESGGSDG